MKNAKKQKKRKVETFLAINTKRCYDLLWLNKVIYSAEIDVPTYFTRTINPLY